VVGVLNKPPQGRTAFAGARDGMLHRVLSIWREEAKAVDFGSNWNWVKGLLTVSSPIIPDWVPKLGGALGGAVSAP